MRPDCWTCVHSIGADARTAKALAQQKGYRDDGGERSGPISIVCVARKRINAVPIDTPTRTCGYERAVGAES